MTWKNLLNPRGFLLSFILMMAATHVGCDRNGPISDIIGKPRESVTTVTEHRTDGITRIFMHKRDQYSILVRQPDKTLQMDMVYIWCGTLTFVEDVPVEEDMYLIERQTFVDGQRDEKRTIHIFHIHAPSDIGGGGWSEGKSGSGQTVPVE